MTRENKLALVLGFGLILFVGILISDHFSTAAQQESADLLQEHVDPLLELGDDDPTLIARSNVRPGPVATNPRELTLPAAERSVPPRKTADHPTIRMPDLLQPPADGPVQGPAAESTLGTHVVLRSETLTSICRHHYGDGRLARALSEYNGLTDADSLRPGDRLRIPPFEELGVAPRTTPAASPRSTTATASPEPRTYTVKTGDTLSELAQTLMGSAGKWRRLYTANKTVIKNPDRLIVGTTLVIPES